MYIPDPSKYSYIYSMYIPCTFLNAFPGIFVLTNIFYSIFLTHSTNTVYSSKECGGTDARPAHLYSQPNRSDDPDPLGPEDARAFLRHAFNCFFHDFCNITHKKIPLMWELTYLRALLSFQSAVLRRGKTFAVLYANRCHTSLPCEIPEEDRDKYNHLIIVKPGGQFHLAPTFVAEVERARAQLQAAKARRNR